MIFKLLQKNKPLPFSVLQRLIWLDGALLRNRGSGEKIVVPFRILKEPAGFYQFSDGGRATVNWIVCPTLYGELTIVSFHFILATTAVLGAVFSVSEVEETVWERGETENECIRSFHRCSFPSTLTFPALSTPWLTGQAPVPHLPKCTEQSPQAGHQQNWEWHLVLYISQAQELN